MVRRVSGLHFDPMSPFPLTVLFVAALLASLLVKFWLATRQMRHVARHRNSVPSAFVKTPANSPIA